MGKRSFTVGYMPPNGYRGLSTPCVRFGGEWLKEFGFEVGDKIELIRGKNMLVLVKAGDGFGAGADMPASAVRLAL
jgi:hypothetical protein